MQEIIIRKLQVNDLFKMVALLNTLVKSGEGWIEKIVKIGTDATSEESNGAENGAKVYELFSEITTKLFSVCTEDIADWFASLVNKSREEFGAMDFDTPVLIIEKIKEAEEFQSFFLKACAVSNAKEKFLSIIENVKKKYASLTD